MVLLILPGGKETVSSFLFVQKTSSLGQIFTSDEECAMAGGSARFSTQVLFSQFSVSLHLENMKRPLSRPKSVAQNSSYQVVQVLRSLLVIWRLCRPQNWYNVSKCKLDPGTWTRIERVELPKDKTLHSEPHCGLTPGRYSVGFFPRLIIFGQTRYPKRPYPPVHALVWLRGASWTARPRIKPCS